MINAYDVGACCTGCPYLSLATYGDTWYKCSNGVCKEFYEAHGPDRAPASYFLPFHMRVGLDPRLSVTHARYLYKGTDTLRTLELNLGNLTPREVPHG